MMVVEIFMYVYTQYGSITFTYLYMYVECSGGRKIALPFREMRSFFGTKSSPREEMQNMAVVEALFIVRQNITGGCKSVEQCFDFFDRSDRLLALCSQLGGRKYPTILCARRTDRYMMTAYQALKRPCILYAVPIQNYISQ